MGRIWEVIEEKIADKYVWEKGEWVQVDISKRGKIHVTLVSDYENVGEEDIKQIVKDTIEARQDEYRVGFINIYTTRQAERLMLSKQEKKKNLIYSWIDSLNVEEQIEEKRKETQVISFYSYKGGVGRTIALIETAYNLAKEGKKVVLLDLDIEAPSLHNIFAKNLADDMNGVKYGIIEYLYRKVVQKSSDVLVEDIFFPLQLDDVSGEIYVIPACKEMNKEYIYQIERIQTRKIQEQEIFEEIFKNLREYLTVDMILIDTRAGFNHWGSLSLLTLSDQVIFISYPNMENVEGLNIAFEMMKSIGKKRYAVAMSKVVASEEGVKKAKNLFGHLEIEQEQIIPIYYKEEIALSNKYPIEDDEVLAAYREISEYILNNEKIERNIEFLSNGVREELLKKVFKKETCLITLSSVRRFLGMRGTTILKYHFSQELNGICEYKSKVYSILDNYLVPNNVYTFWCDELNVLYKELFINRIDDLTKLGMQIIYENIQKTQLDFDKTKVSSRDMKLNEFLRNMEYEVSDIVESWREGKDKPERMMAHDRIRIIIDITKEMMQEKPEVVIENIKGLLSVFNRDIPEIEFKFIIKSSIWDEYQDFFVALKGNVTDVKVSQGDIEDFILKNINISEFDMFEKAIVAHHDNGLLKERGRGAENKIEILQLILGTRKHIKTHSQSIVIYLAEWIKNNPEQRYDVILDCLKQAVRDEIERPDENYIDRLIGFNYIEKEFQTIL